MRARLAAPDGPHLRLHAVGRDPRVPGRARRLLREARRLPLAVDEIIATTGGSEAILFAFFAAADPGDEALVVEPYYTNYRSFATMAGVRLVALPTRGRGRLPPASPRRLGGGDHAEDAPRPPLQPEQSDGHGLHARKSSGWWRSSRASAASFSSWTRCTASSSTTAGGRGSALSLSGFEENVVVVDSLSKRYSACGIRLGCLATRNRDDVPGGAPDGAGPPLAAGARAVRRGRHEGPARPATRPRSSPSTRSGATRSTRGSPAIPGVFLTRPEGAFYFVARLPVADCEDFARWMLADFERDGGHRHGRPGERLLRDAGPRARTRSGSPTCSRKRTCALPVRILQAGLEAYPGRRSGAQSALAGAAGEAVGLRRARRKLTAADSTVSSRGAGSREGRTGGDPMTTELALEPQTNFIGGEWVPAASGPHLREPQPRRPGRPRRRLRRERRARTWRRPSPRPRRPFPAWRDTPAPRRAEILYAPATS